MGDSLLLQWLQTRRGVIFCLYGRLHLASIVLGPVDLSIPSNTKEQLSWPRGWACVSRDASERGEEISSPHAEKKQESQMILSFLRQDPHISRR
jgi:hypothetical protein